MSRDFYFHAERRTGAGWSAVIVPGAGYIAAHPGEFAWMENSSRASDLFFGEDALFPFHPEPAPGSPVHEQVARAWSPGAEGSWVDDRRPAWIAYPDLHVETWFDPTAVLVAGLVPRVLAPAFGHGGAALPESVLLRLGWKPREVVELLATAAVTDAAVDWDALSQMREAVQIPPEYLVEVTWRSSVAALLGASVADAFAAVRGDLPEADLRVVAILA